MAHRVFMKLTRLLFLGFISWALTSVASAQSFTIQKVYTVQHTPTGDVPYTPKVGETYSVAVDFTVIGAASKAYSVNLRLADVTFNAAVTDLTPGQKHISRDWDVPLDDVIPIEATILPPGPVRKGVVLSMSSTFTPVPPTAALDFYDPVTLKGTQTSIYTIAANGLYEFEFLGGCPFTDGWQTALTTSCTVNGGTLASQPMSTVYPCPLYFYSGKKLKDHQLEFQEDFTVKVSAQRVNPTLLRKVTWTDIDALQGINIFKYFEQPETVIQSKDPVIVNFVQGALGGSNYRSKYSPYDACRKVFQAVVKHCNYFYPKPGQTDIRAQNAVQMVQTGTGDCGSFSMLLVACYRCMGIPARTACGAWIGTDAGHCWSEMWFPGASGGWVVTDGSLSDLTSTTGDYAYYFGYVPDLNARFAIMRDNSFQVDNAQANWLQGPMWMPILNGCTITNYVGHTVVAEDSGSPGMKKARADAHLKIPAWNYVDLVRAMSK